MKIYDNLYAATHFKAFIYTVIAVIVVFRLAKCAQETRFVMLAMKKFAERPRVRKALITLAMVEFAAFALGVCAVERINERKFEHVTAQEEVRNKVKWDGMVANAIGRLHGSLTAENGPEDGKMIFIPSFGDKFEVGIYPFQDVFIVERITKAGIKLKFCDQFREKDERVELLKENGLWKGPKLVINADNPIPCLDIGPDRIDLKPIFAL